jgi:hypothetical protein
MRKKTLNVMDIATPGYAKAQRQLCADENIPFGVMQKLIRTGELDTFIMGDRYRYVVLSSWREYLERAQRGEQRDPAAKAAAVKAYRDSCRRSAGAASAARARTGWGSDHGKKPLAREKGKRRTAPSRSKHLSRDPAPLEPTPWEAAIERTRSN